MRLSGFALFANARHGFMLVVVFGLASCSGGKSGLNPVQGKVLYKDEPASGVLVTLTRKGINIKGGGFDRFYQRGRYVRGCNRSE